MSFTRRIRLMLLAFAVLPVLAGYFLYRDLTSRGQSAASTRGGRVWAWLQNPSANPEWAVRVGERCQQAPFIAPTSGLIGFLWGDSFRRGHRHQGLDIFGGEAVGITPVVAAYPGYLTRLPEWKSSLIIRIPEDPLQPGRQIWTYYTHLADADGSSYISPQYPPGTEDVYVDAGALLGYQGNYSGDPDNPTGVHLHFSIVLDDGRGKFLNELEIRNTLNPTPYFGYPLSAELNQGEIPSCPG